MTHRSTCMKIGLIPLATLGALALASGGPAGASSKATTVKAVETSFHIALSKKTFKPGTYTFVAENKSTITHALAITGPGLHNAATADIVARQKSQPHGDLYGWEVRHLLSRPRSQGDGHEREHRRHRRRGPRHLDDQDQVAGQHGHQQWGRQLLSPGGGVSHRGSPIGPVGNSSHGYAPRGRVSLKTQRNPALPSEGGP